jgi:hypothetical protein
VVGLLVERGLVLRSSPRTLPRTWVGAALAAALVALVGAVAFLAARPAPVEDGSKLYALVLDTVSENYSQMDPEEAALLAARYTAWIERIRRAGG